MTASIVLQLSTSRNSFSIFVIIKISNIFYLVTASALTVFKPIQLFLYLNLFSIQSIFRSIYCIFVSSWLFTRLFSHAWSTASLTILSRYITLTYKRNIIDVSLQTTRRTIFVWPPTHHARTPTTLMWSHVSIFIVCSGVGLSHNEHLWCTGKGLG